MSEKEWPEVTENDDGIRPAGRPDECFYCHRKVGETHERDCVTVLKKVRVAHTFVIEEMVPHFWTPEDLKLHHNESSSCAINCLRDVNEYFDHSDRCPCSQHEAKWVELVDDTPVRSNDKGATL